MPFRPGKYLTSPLTVVRFIFHLPKMAVLFHRLMRDKRVPMLTKAIPLLAFAYVILPIDLLPEIRRFGIGYLDDAMVVYFLIKYFFSMVPPKVLQEHVEALSMKNPAQRSQDAA